MTKNQLKTGMIIEFRNNQKAIVLLGTEHNGDIVIGETSFSLNNFSENLENMSDNNYDVMRVLQPEGTVGYAKEFWDQAKVIWERQKFTYPMWFKSVDSKLIVKFTGLTQGTVTSSRSTSVVDKVGSYSEHWLRHTDTTQWIQIEEPVKELTIAEIMTEIEEKYGCKIKIIKGY